VSTAPPEIDEIRRRMAQIRRDLHADVQGVVEGAEAATDWRRYVRSYPWATLGLALTVGYLVVPRRPRTPAPIPIPMAPAIASGSLPAEAPRLAEPEKEKGKGKSLLGAAFGMLAPIAFRAAQGYALQFAEQWLARKMAEQVQNHPDLAAALGGHAERPPGPRAQSPGMPRF
jgi:hypothetical protein